MFDKFREKKRLEKAFFKKTGKKYRYHSTIFIGNYKFYRFKIPKSKDGELILMGEYGDIHEYDPCHWGYDD